jgi:hypothetical protein
MWASIRTRPENSAVVAFRPGFRVAPGGEARQIDVQAQELLRQGIAERLPLMNQAIHMPPQSRESSSMSCVALLSLLVPNAHE